jgi:hypothetical protein
LDHSASMIFENESSKQIPKGGKSASGTSASKTHLPLDDARAAIRKLLRDIDLKKDYVSIAAFCNTVDKKMSLSNDSFHVSAFLDSMFANSTSALYDAMIASIGQVRKANGLKVLLVFSDGNENASKAKLRDVIKAAQKENIPLYIVALGGANRDSLEELARVTKGGYLQIKTAGDLNGIYSNISKNLNIYYDLIYKSTNLASDDNTRKIGLSLATDSSTAEARDTTITLPETAISFMKSKEKSKQTMMFAGIGVLVLLIIIILVFAMKRRKQSEADKFPVIYSVLPNPTTGIVNLNYGKAFGNCVMELTNEGGQTVKTLAFSHLDSSFDLSELANGTYYLFIESKGLKSNSIKLTIQK